MVQTDAVEGVQEGKASLDLVGLDHALEDITDGQGLPLACKMVGNGEDGTEVI